MRTNTISITELAPCYTHSNLKLILNRIKTLHPKISDKCAEQYLSDLLNVDSVDELINDNLKYQEIEPAVDAKELRTLAKRILSYNDNDLAKAIYSARNILNTVPRQVSDLEDYLTEERKLSLYLELSTAAVCEGGKLPPKVTSLSQLKSILEKADNVIIDLIANSAMQTIQAIPMDEHPGLTPRQKMLSLTAVYYVNSEVGFQCNSIWLASFIHNEKWGCVSGWVHRDWGFCNGRHFGFKNEDDVIRLVGRSIDYIDRILSSNDDDTTVKLYIDTLIAALKICKKNYLRFQIETPEVSEINRLLEKHSSIMNDAQQLRYHTVSLLCELDTVRGVPRDHFQNVLEFINQEHTKIDTIDHLMFDYYHFVIADFEHVKTKDFMLGSSFLLSGISPQKLKHLGDTVLDSLTTTKTDENVNGLFAGFLIGYLWSLINTDSNEQFMFDVILDLSKRALPLYPEIIRNIRFMAELGHLASMEEIANMTGDSKNEAAYWNKRIDVRKMAI